jgi:uncharacterized protein (DUF2252 family)
MTGMRRVGVGASDERAAGRAARERAPRSSHADWAPPSDRSDPVARLERDNEGRLPHLVPMRFARMLESPFAFFRGAASVMADDLQHTPVSGIAVQLCGDAHLLNFGAFATPERQLVFDVNDFDETVDGGAWEWDIKRLAASVAIAARHLRLHARDGERAVRASVRAYREATHGFAAMRVLDVWYARLEEDELAEAVRSAEARRAARAKALERPSVSSAHLFPKLVAKDGPIRIADHPPLVFHPADADAFRATAASALAHYRRSLPPERRALLERFAFVDAAYKVVGVGSVGTRCLIALLVAGKDDPLILQLKEARASVFEPYVDRGAFVDHGERVVVGQRLMQAASDVFLGWARANDGITYYVRQLRDVKTSTDVERMRPRDLERYAALCGAALARAHAKASGRAAAIAGYLGRSTAFDAALAAFADAYAEQNERDYAALVAAAANGRITAR